jgi:lysophospholipase
MRTEVQPWQASRVPDVERTVAASDGTELRYCAWSPGNEGAGATAIRAGVLIVPGFGEHMGRYGRLGRALAGEGFLAAGGDLRGFGHSQGSRGHVVDFLDYVRDVEVLEATLIEELPAGVPYFIFGHSMGGLVALKHAEESGKTRASGTILSAPMLGLAKKPAGWKVAFGQRLAKLAPKFRIPLNLKPADLMRDPDEQVKLLSDMQYVKSATLSWYFAAERAMLWGRRNIPNVSWPTLWLVPGEDLVCSSRITGHVFKLLPDYGDHTMKQYPGCFHELHNDTPDQRDAAFADMVSWIRDRVKSRPART